ncbi:MAG: hypothetical protein MZW92_18605 [Comamonadaceae bacterium]|nr:hypothetical protein [Comamonadaceae bacterium]
MGLFAGTGVGKSRAAGHDGALHRGRRHRRRPDRRARPRGQGVHRGHPRRARAARAASSSPRRPTRRRWCACRAPTYATAIAEHFRDRGQHVLLLMDSLTRYAMAQREIALAIGEPPATKGYPPSVLRQAAAAGRAQRQRPATACGSITAFYTVLSEGDDPQDPIADAARGILDGHIVLVARAGRGRPLPGDRRRDARSRA